jgi:hypothetical protein
MSEENEPIHGHDSDAIRQFIDEIPTDPEAHAKYFNSLPNQLELSHVQFLQEKDDNKGSFSRQVMIPRIQLFNELYTSTEKAALSSKAKKIYRKYLDLYSTSTNHDVFQSVKKINAKKETKSFWIQSFNTSVIYNVINQLEKHTKAMKIMENTLKEEVGSAIVRATNSVQDDQGETRDDDNVVGDGETTEKKQILGYSNKESYKKIRKFYSKSEDAFSSYYEFHKRFYLKHILLKRSYINAFSVWIDQLGNDKSTIYEYYKQFRKDINKVNNDISLIVAESFEFVDEMGGILNDAEKELKKVQSVLTDQERKVLEVGRGKVSNMQIQTLNKINTLYNNTSAMALILDNQFTYMYILKVVTYGLQYIGLFFAEKIFSDMYTKTVYVRNHEPPSILTFYGIYLGFAIAMMLFMIVILYIISLIFNTPLNTYLAINNDLIIKYIVDMIIFHVFTGLLLCVIGALMQRKKYFKYKTEGPRAIRAYSEAISIISAITIMLPYFLVA